MVLFNYTGHSYNYFPLITGQIFAKTLAKRFGLIAINTFDAVGAGDAIRIDFREDELGNIYVIDVNGTPSLSLTSSLTFMASKVGLTHSQLIKLIFYESIVRYNLAPTYLLEEIISKIQARLATYPLFSFRF